MKELNERLSSILDSAAEIQRDSQGFEQTSHQAGAIRYAVLKRLEADERLPVMVKYGDADAVAAEYGVSDDPVWGVDHREDWTLFRIEPEEELTVQQTDEIHKTMLAIGAWYVGMTAPPYHYQVSADHYHYLWSTDHPVTGMVPEIE